jgi:hypothetical protein
MKDRETILVAIIIFLMLFSGCSGSKPYFSTDSLPGFIYPYTRVYKVDRTNTDYFSDIPSSSALSSRDNIMPNMKKGTLKLSISFPPSARLNF